MTFSLIYKRMRRAWRSLGMLLLAVGMLSAFFALGPLYIRVVTENGLRRALAEADPTDLYIRLILDGAPMPPQTMQKVGEVLGPLAVGYRHYIRADYTPPTRVGSIEDPGRATGGYLYTYGDPVTWISPRLPNTFQPFAFDNMAELLELVDGRWPMRLPPPEAVDPTGLSDAEQQALGVGPYTRGQVEVVVTRKVAEQAGLEVGSRFVLGTKRVDGSGHVAVVVVVGIVEPKDPDDPFWKGNRMFTEGALVETGLGRFRFDYGLATIPEAFTDWLRDVVPGSAYIYDIFTDPSVINADNLQDYRARLAALTNTLNAHQPRVEVLSGLIGILEGYAGDVSATEGPIVFLSGAVLVLMLYHLVNTVALVLEQQSTEWSSIVSRGGSVRQLVGMQAVTMGVLGLGGLALGPLLSLLFMRALERFGPLATALGGETVNLGLPRISLALSALAALLSVLVLTLPAWPAARRSLLRLKQRAARPPTRPFWTRYALDFALTAVGVGFLLRLYYLVGGNFGDLLQNLLAAPRDVVTLIADNLNESGGLNDPFNVLGPALVLTGLAMLWLRFFPWLMERVSALLSGSRSLTTPLAVWNVARDPGHYAQLVLLLIGTLALGTASLGLSETRERGAWQIAREEVGGGARVTLEPSQGRAEDVRWAQLPNVSAATVLLHTVGDPGTSALRDVHLFGVDADSFAADFPALAEALRPLRGVEVPPAPGLALPLDATALSVQVYALPMNNPDDPPASVQLSAYLLDAVGVPFRVVLTPPQTAALADVETAESGPPPTPTDEWLTFFGELPQAGQRPFRLIRLGVNSTAGDLDAFAHTIYLDRLATLDVFGTATVVESFEDAANAWAPAPSTNPYAASWAATAADVHRLGGVELEFVREGDVPPVDGTTALKLSYRMGRLGGRQREPSLAVNWPQQNERLPIVVNSAFAEQYKGRSISDEPLSVGDVGRVVLSVGTGSVELSYEVVGLVADVPTVEAREPALFVPLGLVRPILNQAGTFSAFFDANEVWLELREPQPSAALEGALAEVDGVTDVTWAWTRYGELLREPLPSAVAGMLFAGFWISLLLSLLDFAFYLVVTARQRLFTFGVLRALGWDTRHIWQLLFVEQVALVGPALVVGSAIGAALAYLLLPFLALVGAQTLRMPWLSWLGMLAALVGGFGLLMGVAAALLRRMSVNQVLRLGEE